MRAKIGGSLTEASLGTRYHLVAAENAAHLLLEADVVLAALHLAEKHGVEDVLVGGHGVGWDEQEDPEPF